MPIDPFQDMPPPKSAREVYNAWHEIHHEREAKEKEEQQRFELLVAEMARECQQLLAASLLDQRHNRTAGAIACIDFCHPDSSKDNACAILKIMLEKFYMPAGYVVSVKGFRDISAHTGKIIMDRIFVELRIA